MPDNLSAQEGEAPSPTSTLGSVPALLTSGSAEGSPADSAPAETPLPQPLYWFDSSTSERAKIRCFQVKIRLSAVSSTQMVFLETSPEEIKEKFGLVAGITLASILQSLPGVIDFAIGTYELKVAIGRAFDFKADGIHELIVRAFEAATGTTFEVSELPQ